MTNDKLTKADALKLIASVIDNEAGEEEREAFFNFIDNDDEVRRKYKSLKNLKAFIAKQCPRACAPESLKSKIRSYIRSAGNDDRQTGTKAPIYDIPTGGPSRIKSYTIRSSSLKSGIVPR